MKTPNTISIRCWLLSLRAATLAPTVVTVAYFSLIIGMSPSPFVKEVLLVAIVAIAVSAAHVLVLAYPGILALRHWRQLSANTICLLGAVTGAAPLALWTWPLSADYQGRTSTYWDGSKTVSDMIDGVPTMIGWINYLEGIGTTAILGIISALAFWFVWQRFARVETC